MSASNVQRARQVMAAADSSSLLDDPGSLERQVDILDTLQGLAFNNAERGGIVDITDWCLRGWLRVLRHHPQDVRVLTSIGRWWLARAQPLLARIATQDNTSSSSGSASPASTLSGLRTTIPTEERRAHEAALEAEARMHLPDYVEARGVLQPATEYLSRAVTVATAQTELTGELLITAAEAYMSLGNVSYAKVGEGIFEHAVLYLRAASNLPGFSPPDHLRRWLEDVGRFVP